jgi:hypothetical protein
VAGFPDHASTLERLERLADAALYVAKRRGRNRVELASVEAGPDLPGPVLPEVTVGVPVPVPASVPASASVPVPVPVPRGGA